MKKRGCVLPFLNKKIGVLFYSLLISILWFGAGPIRSVSAIELDPYPVLEIARDSFSINFFREERPSFYWVNIGVPDAFFAGVSQVFTSPIVYSVRSIEFGVQVNHWLTDQFQLRATIPFEANALEDSTTGATHSLEKFGDLELGATFLLTGKREKGNFIGVDGWYRFATGTNPVTMAYPLLSSGKGASDESIGIVMGQELSGFSFFQSIHYETTQPIQVPATSPLFSPGVFQWPDNIEALGRVEWLVFHRAQRFVSFYYQLRMRMSGLMELNQQALPYSYKLNTDQLLFSTFGLIVRTDKEFSAECQFTNLPYELSGTAPDFGWLFSLSLVFRPI
ncbi:MAG TPA: hypothetical protein VIJ93_09820 [bacterium]